MADFSWYLFIITYFATVAVYCKGAGFDLTCFNNYPLLIPNDNDDAFIGGYKGGLDYGEMNVAFSRSVDTGTGSDLPTGHSEGNYNNGRSRRLLMPIAGKNERIGALTCEGDQNGESYNITAIITDINGDPRSQQVTITASLGDRVNLEVTRDVTSKSIKWSKNGKYLSDFDEQTTLVIESVTSDDGGIYDCYYDGERKDSKQAIILLIVRACPSRLWGPDCSNDCPFCYNGGVCEDKAGDCICAPGFGGTYCDQIYGRNTFGQVGDHHCSGSSDNSSPGCMGKQICGLDPYGCSCAAGYKGRDCNSECDPVTYGADCKQTCHCTAGAAACDHATGTCKTGTCLDGWTGDNCQACGDGVGEMLISSFNSTSIIVSWTSPVEDATFVVEYKPIYTDQCQPENINPITLPPQNDSSVLLFDLSPYSTYQLTVNSNTWPPCQVDVEIKTFITDEGAPSQEPQNVRITEQGETSLSFQWDPIECGYRGGANIIYEYSINSTPPRSGVLSETSLSITSLDACAEYVFRIKATNAAGAGPEAIIDAATKYRAPGNVNGLNVSGITDQSDELHVTWDSDQCADAYTVLYSKIIIDQCLNTTEPLTPYWDGDDTSVTITGLEAYTTYQVVVYSNNSLGYGESKGIGVTDSVAPSGSPENVNLNSRTNTSLTFEWSRVPCGQRGGPNEFTYTLFDMNGKVVETDTVPGLSATVYGLESCTNYSIVVKAVNDKGIGNPATPVFGETDEGVLGPVQKLKTENVTSTEWDLSWNAQNSSPCETREYLVEYTLTKRDQCEVITDPKRVVFGNVSNPLVEISGLNPNSDYIVYVTPLNGYGHGMETSESGTTLESAPSGAPEDLQVSSVDKDHIAYSWDQPKCGERNGVVTEYIYSSSSGQQGRTTNTSLQINDLNPCSEYEFSVSAVVNTEGGPEDIVVETTGADVPNQPSDLQQQDKVLNQMTVSWKEPFPQYCIITKYVVTRRAINKPYDEDFVPDLDPEDEKEIDDGSFQHTFVDLEPSTEYEIQVWAFTEAGPGDLIKGPFYTAAASTPEYLGEPITGFEIVDSTATTKTVLIPQVDDPTQYVTEYRILVEGPSVNIHSTSYIAGVVDVKELESESVEFIVGDGLEGSSNPPLKKDTRYTIYIETCSVISESEAGCVASDGKSHGGVEPFPWWAYMLIILAVCIVVVPAVGFVIFNRAKRNKTDNDNMNFGRSYDLNPYDYGNQEEDTKFETSDTKAAVPSKKSRAPPTPVQITNFSTFAHYVAVKQSRNGQDTSFEEDYERLPHGALHSYDVFKLDENREKNRYKNIATYDHSRVKLTIPEGDPPTDYINASFIDGYKHPRQYIATQGPNVKSTSAFWRMVWETECSKIVMLTNVVENGKVKSAKYWPDKLETYGNFTVTLIGEDDHLHYTVRYFIINDVSQGGFVTREVCQFHYTTWPDMGVPDNAAALVDFVYAVSEHQPVDGNPTVVHCSAGVGRSGTFITIESMMRQGKEEGQIDVFKFVSDMRHKRMHMIQTEDQYEFIFEALLVHFIYGDTAIPVDSFRDEYTKLKSRNHKTNVTGLAVQFQNLEDISIMPTRFQCSAASSKENVNKNRFEDMLAADQTRPFLMSEGEPGDKTATNYINATFLNGYRTRDAFLTTQMPMPNTVCDFWRMVYDYNCHTIVMLNSLDLHDQTTKKYWPIKGNLSIFGPFNVECVSKKKVDEEITSRILKLKKTKSEEGSERTIVHFSVKNWSNDGKAAPSKRTIGTLAMTVSDRIKETKDGRVCVHCIDGMGISGTFVAITAAIQQLNQEKTVDIFQTVKRLRMCNPRVVPTKTQFRFIFEVIQDSLLSGHMYENYVTP